MDQKNIPILIATTMVASLVIGGSVYWWQQSILQKLKNENQQQLNVLSNQLNQAEETKSDLQQQVDDITQEKNELQQELYEFTKEPERYVKVISPNGGEAICLNDEVIIKWESKGVDVVSVRVIKQAFSGTNYYYIDLNAVPATYNEAAIPGKGITPWKVKNIPIGHGYKLEIMSTGAISQVKDTSDGVFSIIACEG